MRNNSNIARYLYHYHCFCCALIYASLSSSLRNISLAFNWSSNVSPFFDISTLWIWNIQKIYQYIKLHIFLLNRFYILIWFKFGYWHSSHQYTFILMILPINPLTLTTTIVWCLALRTITIRSLTTYHTYTILLLIHFPLITNLIQYIHHEIHTLLPTLYLHLLSLQYHHPLL